MKQEDNGGGPWEDEMKGSRKNETNQMRKGEEEREMGEKW